MTLVITANSADVTSFNGCIFSGFFRLILFVANPRNAANITTPITLVSDIALNIFEGINETTTSTRPLYSPFPVHASIPSGNFMPTPKLNIIATEIPIIAEIATVTV